MKILLFANTDWYLYNFRLSLAKAIQGAAIDIVLISPPGEYSERLISEGFRWIPINMDRRSVNPLSQIFVIARLTQIYKKERPDLVHHFTLKCVLYGTIAARFAKVRNTVNAVAGLGYVFTNSGLLARSLRLPVKVLLRVLMKDNWNRLILQNRDDCNVFLEEKIIDRENIRIILSSGVDVERFSPKPREQESKKLNVLLATRMLWDKGIKEFVEAARILRSSGCSANFLLAGAPDQGNPSSVSEVLLTEWGEEGIVQYVGVVEDMATFLEQIDMVVLPSYREGVPRILLEAAATGLPLIATDVPGCREIVSHRVNGLLVPARDAKSLAHALKQLINDPVLRKAMGEEGRNRVIHEFDSRIVIEKTFAVYRELFPSFNKHLQTVAL